MNKSMFKLALLHRGREGTKLCSGDYTVQFDIKKGGKAIKPIPTTIGDIKAG